MAESFYPDIDGKPLTQSKALKYMRLHKLPGSLEELNLQKRKLVKELGIKAITERRLTGKGGPAEDKYKRMLNSVNFLSRTFLKRKMQITLDPTKVKDYRRTLSEGLKPISRLHDPSLRRDTLAKRFAKVVKLNPNMSEKESQELKEAYEQLNDATFVEQDTRDLIKKNLQSRRKQLYQRVSRGSEEKFVDEILERENRLAVQEAIDKGLLKVQKYIKGVFRKNGKPHVQVYVKGKKSHKRAIIVTASLLTAILGGAYLYNKYSNTYRRRITYQRKLTNRK